MNILPMDTPVLLNWLLGLLPMDIPVLQAPIGYPELSPGFLPTLADFLRWLGFA